MNEFGYKAFALPPGKKSPPPTGWQRLAGRVTIPEGWNTGWSTENFAVADIDWKPLIARFEKKYRELITTVVETPRGGRHYYFNGETRNQQNDGWDVRGVGGYIVAPGSQIGGKVYKLLTELRPISELKRFPDELQKKVVDHSVRPSQQPDPILRIKSARVWLSKADPVVRGQEGSDDKMFFACCRMFQLFNLTMDQAIGPILEYNARCRPPFTDKEIKHKLEDALAAGLQK